MWSDAEDDLFDDFTDAAPAAVDGARGDSFDTGSQRSFDGKNMHANSISIPRDTQRRDRIVVSFDNDHGEPVEPSNEFEKMLLREGIEVRRDENYSKYMYIGDITSDVLAIKLESSMRVRRFKDDLLEAFEEALKQQENLITYLEASHSSCGIQESIFRVLILCRSSQGKVFDLLMSQLQNLQKGNQKETLNLSHLCIAQMRFINRIYCSQTLFCSIFERDIEKWSPPIRNSLISSIPEVLTDVVVQQEAVKELQSLLLRDVKTDPIGCKLAVISALSLLNADVETSKRMQDKLTKSLSDFDVELLPSLIDLLTQRLEISNKGALANLLTQLSTNLYVDRLRITRRGKLHITLDGLVGEIFDKISQFVVLSGETGWKEVQRFFRSEKSTEKSGATQAASQDSVADSDPDSSRALTLFDILLSIDLLALRTCPLSASNVIKQRFLLSQDNLESLSRLFGEALKFKSLCERNVSPLISIAQQCLWSAKEETQKFGAKLFKDLFIALTKCREHILKTMLSHSVQSESESEAVLYELTDLIDTNAEAIEPFISLITEYFFILDRMSIPNIKRFFRAIFRLYAAKPSTATQKDNLNDMIPLFLRSANNVQPVFGVLAVLIKLETALLLDESSSRESDVECSLKLLEEARSSSAYIRTCCYNELPEVLRMCFGCSKSSAMNQWLTVFIEEFRSDFFTDSYEPSRELEGERYANSETSLWLKCLDGQNLGEAIPLLEAVTEAIRLQETWPSAETMEATQRDRWTRIFYALNANISMEGVEGDSKDSCDALFRTIQWIRTLYNVFAEEEACPAVDSGTIDVLWTKKFLLMFECHKELISKVKSLGQWPLPDRTPLSMVTVVAAEAKKKPVKKAPKRKRAAVIEEDVPPPTQPILSKEIESKSRSGRNVTLAKMMSCMKPLKLSAVVKLLELMQGKRRASIFLIEHLLEILVQVCPRVAKKSLPWAKRSKVGICIHGDLAVVFGLIEKLLPVFWSTFSRTVSYFRDFMNSSAVVTNEADVVEQLANLFRLCLATLEHLFSWNHITSLPSDSDAVSSRKKSRRDKLMGIIEHCILQEDGERSAGSEAEVNVYGYLVDVCEQVPNVGVAIALLGCISVLRAPSEELSNKMARYTLGFLKKEWVDKEGHPLKGATLTSAVRKILSHYLRLRPVQYRLCAIQWILAKKLADLIPHEERRKSKVYEQDSDDHEMNERYTGQIFACFTRATFGTIYKVLFIAMNDALTETEISPSNSCILRRGSVQEYLHTWSIAAGCVALFGLMLRVRELRNTSLLVTAIKEGRRFLALMSNKNGSFMYLLEEKSRLASVTDRVVEIIKSVQIGNRNFQNICVHAKANRSNILLKLVPDFRVTNEQWMRAIQAKFVGINCEDAFEIGLLKPRDINGEEIVYSADERSPSISSESSTEQNAEEVQADSDDSRTSEVF
ncbi:hypothetical protein V3C99_010342 [Haemonchus contortus]